MRPQIIESPFRLQSGTVTDPDGAQQVRVQDPNFPDRWHLVCCVTPERLVLYRRQDTRHYGVPLDQLMPPEIREIYAHVRGEARRRKTLVHDVLIDLGCQASNAFRTQRDTDESEALAMLRAAAGEIPIADFTRALTDSVQLCGS